MTVASIALVTQRDAPEISASALAADPHADYAESDTVISPLRIVVPPGSARIEQRSVGT
jgi:hypothetical protein